jgi:U2-associated protein SR140
VGEGTSALLGLQTRLTLHEAMASSKNLFALEQAAKLAKKKQAEAEAAAVLDSFVTSFGDASSAGSALWVRGGVEGGGAGSGAGLYVMDAAAPRRGVAAAAMFADDSASVPLPTTTAAAAAAAGKRREMDAFLEELKQRQEGGGGGRARAQSYASDRPCAGHDLETTSNLCVGDLAPSVREEELSAVFSRYGRVTSVEIMRPRTEEERACGRHTGFVLFAERREAEAAMKGMQDATLGGGRVTLAWARSARPAAGLAPLMEGGHAAGGASTLLQAVQIPLRSAGLRADIAPFPGLPSSSPAGAAGGPAASARRTLHIGWDARQPGPRSAALATAPPLPSVPLGAHLVPVPVPALRLDRQLADLWAMHLVCDTSASLDMALRSLYSCARAGRQEGGAEAVRLPWLEEGEAGGHAAAYLQWRTWSLLQGDALHTWRTAPYQVIEGGVWWRPPPCPLPDDLEAAECEDEAALMRDAQKSRGRRKVARGQAGNAGSEEGRGKLSLAAQAEWSSLIGLRAPPSLEVGPDDPHAVSLPGEGEDSRADGTSAASAGLSLSNPAVRVAMVFALDHAEAAAPLVGTLLRALADPQATAQSAVARLYVAADILAASATATVRNASAFRSALQAGLPDAFEALGARLRGGHVGRMSREALRERVLRVLAAWERSFVFSLLYTTGLGATLVRPHAVSEDGGPDASVAEVEDLARRCRLAGLSAAGGAAAMSGRLAWVTQHVKSALLDVSSTLEEDLRQSADVDVVPQKRLRRRKRSRDEAEAESGVWKEEGTEPAYVGDGAAPGLEASTSSILAAAVAAASSDGRRPTWDAAARGGQF